MNVYRNSAGTSKHLTRFFFALPVLFMLLANDASATRKTDIVYLKNGDRITGEFKEMIQGELKFSTTEMGTIYIKWAGIERIESDKYIEIELSDGTKMFGQIPAELNQDTEVMGVRTLKEEPFQVTKSEVVRAEQIRLDDSIWARLDGYISLGLNYTQASDVLTWNFAGLAKYRTQNNLTSLEFDSTITRKGSDESNETTRNNLIGSRYWYMDDRWFTFGSGGAQQNDELGLALRIFGTGGFGRFLVQSQKTEFYLATGLSLNKENETGDEDINESLSDAGANIEALVSADYTFYRLYSPKSRIKAAGTLYSTLNNSSRYRGTANLTLRQEFIKDLFWDLSFYYDYDSKPLQGAVAQEDYGVVTSLGYEF